MFPEKGSSLKKKKKPGQEGEGSHTEAGMTGAKAGGVYVSFPTLTPKHPFGLNGHVASLR